MWADWHRWSLVEAADRLRTRQVGAVELVDAVLRRIEDVDGEVRSFVTVTPDLARRQARAAQRMLDRHGGGAPPLTGVPVVLKDLIDVRGCITTAGSKVLVDNVAQSDAAVWRRLRMAGAVLLGKVNTHEFAYGGTTEPTRNPWDTTRIVGGSSGGSAAALAAGMCFGALGTDTAGSIRIPAGFCGVVGLKPTRGAVSTRGVLPLSPTLDCVGPMARTPGDVERLFAAIGTGKQPRSGETATAHCSPRGLRVLVARGVSVTAEVESGLDAAATVLADAGAVVLDGGDACLDGGVAARANFTIMAAEAARIHRTWLATSSARYTPYVRARLEQGMRTTAVEYLDALDESKRIRQRWDVALADSDLLLTTGMPSVAPRAGLAQVEVNGELFDRDWLMCRDTAFANITGHPVLAVPSGTADGLPIGVQLVAHRHREAVLFLAGQIIFDALASPIP